MPSPLTPPLFQGLVMLGSPTSSPPLSLLALTPPLVSVRLRSSKKRERTFSPTSYLIVGATLANCPAIL